MNSRLFLNIAFLFSILTVFAQTDSGEKTFNKVTKLSNHIYMIQGNGGNIGLSIGTDGVFMIDSQYDEEIEQIQREIKKLSDKPVRILLNTHFHEDHTGGNTAMAKTGTVIYAQENVRTRLQETIDAEKKKIQKESLPMVTFAENFTLHFNGEEVRVFHVPNAHTDGDAMVYFTKSNVFHTGDIFFNGKYPFIDVDNGGSFGGFLGGISKALSTINENTKIIPGHGEVATYKDLKNAEIMLTNTYKKVAQQFLLKKSESEILAMTELTQEYDALGYGKGFINRESFIKMLYSEFAKERGVLGSNNEKNKKALEKIEQMKRDRKLKKKN